MSALTLWLPTRVGGRMFAGGSALYVKEIDTPFLPRAGDQIHILRADEEDDGWSCGAYVNYAFWNGDGEVHVQLLEHVIDPEPDINLHRTQTAWRTDQDGDLPSRLLASGWRTWEQWRAARRQKERA